MQASMGWFIAMAFFAVGMAMLGMRLGGGPRWGARLALLGGMLLLLGWAWLTHHPAVAVDVLPLTLLSYIEGIASVPAFMLVIGVAWARSVVPRQRRVVALAGAIGAIYFINGGLWMLQSTPTSAFAESGRHGIYVQSESYSCGAAASATALTMLGITSTEAQMAQLTYTRPGTGTTTIRTLLGLRRRLVNTPHQVDLLEPTYEELQSLPMPALTPLREAATQRHMVTLLEVRPNRVVLIDPVSGYQTLTRDEFMQQYDRQALVFRLGAGASPHRVVDANPQRTFARER